MTQKLFMELDDDLFFNEVVNSNSNDNGIKENLNNMKLFEKLKSEFLIINNINDYKSVQNKLYGDKSRREIIEFELVRIIDNFGNNDFIALKLVNIEKLLKMYDNDIPDDTYKLIINLIIKIELMLDMKIGLFVELCELFESLSKKNIYEEEISYK